MKKTTITDTKEKKKTFLLDTNVLMKYPNAIYGFDDNDVVVTATTIEELDNLKSLQSEKGADARSAIRQIDKVRSMAKEQGTTLSQKVLINDGKGTFHVEKNHIDPTELPQGWDNKKADNRIIACAKNIGAILVTEDRAMAIKADELDIQVESYRNAQVEVEDTYLGYGELYISAERFNEFHKNKKLEVIEDDYGKDIDKRPEENQYFILYNCDDPQHPTLARYTDGILKPLIELPKSCKVKPKNKFQEFIIDALLDPEIPLVIINGAAGTAKTFLTMTAAMQGYMTDMWSQIICTRNNVEMDSHGIGALPGDEVEKIGPLMRGVLDNLRNYLIIQGTDEKDVEESIEDYIKTGVIKFEAMSFMRGRSITNSIIFLDESQNATPHQIHSIITRAGANTKVVCCGDPGQIDDIKLDKKNNGLVFAQETMRGSKFCCQITMGDDETASTRSKLATDATLRMSRAFT